MSFPSLEDLLGLHWLGDWVPEKTYEIHDVVIYQRTIYVCTSVNTGIAPTDTSAWLVYKDSTIVPATGIKGDKGDPGLDGSGAIGSSILKGPYIIDYLDIPHDGDKMTLWTPQVGDVLLRLFPDWQTVEQWSSGKLFIGQNVDGTAGSSHNIITVGTTGLIGNTQDQGLDNMADAFEGEIQDASGAQKYTTAYVFHTTDPLQVQLAQTGGTDPTQGHVELYALVAQPISP